jgi:4a-hydroxytetrahydrobiopterin dehydratase
VDARAPRVIDRATCETRLRALLKSGFGPGLPRREADRFILLHELAGLFDPMEPLAEKPLTERLAAWLEGTGSRLSTDPVTLRRAMIDDGFLERDGRGLAYRRSRAHEMRVVFVEGPAQEATGEAAGGAGEHCTPCREGAPPIPDDAAAEQLLDLPDWTIERVGGVPRLSRAFVFADFAAALAFAVRVGAEAEAEGHHPELRVEWGRVTVGWWTHAIGGLHRNDFVMAARTDRVFASPADA